MAAARCVGENPPTLTDLISGDAQPPHLTQQSSLTEDTLPKKFLVPAVKPQVRAPTSESHSQTSPVRSSTTSSLPLGSVSQPAQVVNPRVSVVGSQDQLSSHSVAPAVTVSAFPSQLVNQSLFARPSQTFSSFPVNTMGGLDRAEGKPIFCKSHSVAFGTDSVLGADHHQTSFWAPHGQPDVFTNNLPPVFSSVEQSSSSFFPFPSDLQSFKADDSFARFGSVGSDVSEPDIRVLRRSESVGFGFASGSSARGHFSMAKGSSGDESQQRNAPVKLSWRKKDRLMSSDAPADDTHALGANYEGVKKMTGAHTPAHSFSHSDEDQISDMIVDSEMPDSHKPPPKSVPPLHRQLSRRRSYQQATSGASSPSPATATIQPSVADDSGVADVKGSEEEEEGYEEEEEDSPSYTPPGSPSPKSRRVDNMSFDPYQIFEVQHLPCMILTVKVLRGRNITNGWAQDLIDTPDPYVFLRLKTAPEGRKRTRTIDNDCNPIWNESFDFYLNFSETHVLEITLMEANPLNLDQKIGTVYFNIDRIVEFGRSQTEVFNFNGTTEVDIEFHLEWDQNPTLRYSLCLSDKEKEFMRKRKQKVFEGLNRLLGEQGPRTVEEAPTIAVIGSGGGFRAMTGYSGVFKALADSGLLDCTTYACGLSGSSWYLSTLYSHPRWPEMNPGDLQDELMYNIDKSLMWLLGPNSVMRYLDSVLKKRREGQPISFTDFFGHMVGETLLKGRMHSRLTDQRAKIQDADVPLPLYTCVHVKKDVPARSFQEWVEFSPYEIGMPKYGTFMDSELFGSKFFMGKLVRKYQEQPLHFLQGIWGSAFCILFKRLLEDNRRLDPAEMIRQEMGKQLEQTQDNDDDSSDLSSDEDDDEESEKSDLDADDLAEDSAGERRRSSVTSRSEERRYSGSGVTPGPFGSGVGQSRRDSRQESTESSDTTDGESSFIDLEPPRSFLPSNGSSSDSFGFDEVGTPTPSDWNQGMEVPRRSSSPGLYSSNNNDDGSETLSSTLTESQKKGVRFSQGVERYEKRKERKQQKQQRQQIRQQQQRPALKRVPTARRGKSRSYWSSVLKGIFENQKFELLSTRAGRAAVIHNFMRGLSLQQTYPLSPFTPVHERVQEGDEFDGIFEMHPTHIKHIYMVDAGLTFNSPYPLVLRPQRGTDIILSFDFSARPSDSTPPFKELKLAERWAKLNRLPFPPIDTSVFDVTGMKELYVFRDPDDPHCPVVLHFALVNTNFRQYKAPGVPRETREEFDFADFDIFDDPTTPYSTFNFTYQHQHFERLSKLMEFNTLNNLEEIKHVLADVVAKKRQVPSSRMPIHTRDIKLLRMKSVQERRELKKFLKKMESRASSNKTPTPTGSAPPTPFFTPTPLEPIHQRNPFVFHNKSGSGSDSGSKSSTDSSPEEMNPFFKTLRQDSVTSHRNGKTQKGPGESEKDSVKQAMRRQGTAGFAQHDSRDFLPKSSSELSRDSSDEVFHGSSRNNHILPSSCTTRNTPPSSTSEQELSRQQSGEFGNFQRDSAPLLGSVQQESRLSRGSSTDEFHDAPEAFTREGVPVTDPVEAKKHYEGAKMRRKMLRRQSTISSLNSITESISLDSENKSRISQASEPEHIDVADLEQFEGIVTDNNYHTSHHNNDHNDHDDHWFDAATDPHHRGSVVTANGEDNR